MAYGGKYPQISSLRTHLVFSSFSQPWADIVILKVSDIRHSSYSMKMCLQHYFPLHCYLWDVLGKRSTYIATRYSFKAHKNANESQSLPEIKFQWPGSPSKSLWSVHFVGANEALVLLQPVSFVLFSNYRPHSQTQAAVSPRCRLGCWGTDRAQVDGPQGEITAQRLTSW